MHSLYCFLPPARPPSKPSIENMRIPTYTYQLIKQINKQRRENKNEKVSKQKQTNKKHVSHNIFIPRPLGIWFYEAQFLILLRCTINRLTRLLRSFLEGFKHPFLFGSPITYAVLKIAVWTF